MGLTKLLLREALQISFDLIAKVGKGVRVSQMTYDWKVSSKISHSFVIGINCQFMNFDRVFPFIEKGAILMPIFKNAS